MSADHDGSAALIPTPSGVELRSLDWLHEWLRDHMPAWLLEALRAWPSHWPEEIEAAYQRELTMRKQCKQQLRTMKVSRSDYTGKQLRPADRDGFHSASILVTNQGRLLMLFVREKNGSVKLTFPAGKRNHMDEDAWSCACRETVEETGGVAELGAELEAASPTRVGWASNQKMAVFEHETACHDLAERVQELQRPPEGVYGVLPPEGVLSALWAPIDELRKPDFLAHFSNHANAHVMRLALPLIFQREDEEAKALMEEEARLSEAFADLCAPKEVAPRPALRPAMSERGAGKQRADAQPDAIDNQDDSDSSHDDAPPHSTSDATCGDTPLKDPPPITFPPKWTVRGAAKPSVPDWRRDAAYKAKQERIRAKEQRMRNARDKRMR